MAWSQPPPSGTTLTPPLRSPPQPAAPQSDGGGSNSSQAPPSASDSWVAKLGDGRRPRRGCQVGATAKAATPMDAASPSHSSWAPAPPTATQPSAVPAAGGYAAPAPVPLPPAATHMPGGAVERSSEASTPPEVTAPRRGGGGWAEKLGDARGLGRRAGAEGGRRQAPAEATSAGPPSLPVVAAVPQAWTAEALPAEAASTASSPGQPAAAKELAVEVPWGAAAEPVPGASDAAASHGWPAGPPAATAAPTQEALAARLPAPAAPVPAAPAAPAALALPTTWVPDERQAAASPPRPPVVDPWASLAPSPPPAASSQPAAGAAEGLAQATAPAADSWVSGETWATVPAAPSMPLAAPVGWGAAATQAAVAGLSPSEDVEALPCVRDHPGHLKPSSASGVDAESRGQAPGMAPADSWANAGGGSEPVTVGCAPLAAEVAPGAADNSNASGSTISPSGSIGAEPPVAYAGASAIAAATGDSRCQVPEAVPPAPPPPLAQIGRAHV